MSDIFEKIRNDQEVLIEEAPFNIVMKQPLFLIFCIADVPAQTCTRLLKEAYDGCRDAPASLHLVHDEKSLHTKIYPGPTLPPVHSAPSSDFHGMSSGSLAAYVRRLKLDHFSKEYFLVADSRTTEDQTMDLVKCAGGKKRCLRVASKEANGPVVAMSIGCGGFEELESQVGADGVYRGGTGPPPKKGGPTSPKILGKGK